MKIKTNRLFTTSSIMKGDNSDILKRVEELMTKNQNLIKESKLGLLDTQRQNMEKKLDQEDKIMKNFIEMNTTSLTTEDEKKFIETQENSKNFFHLILKKAEELNKEDSSYAQKLHSLNQLAKDTKNRETDNLESFVFEAVKRDMDKSNASPFEKTMFFAARRKRLEERKEILATNKELYIKEQEEFKKEKEEKLSLIDDFANPNLEQPSYMDPED
jgi:hypothetical protein